MSGSGSAGEIRASAGPEKHATTAAVSNRVNDDIAVSEILRRDVSARRAVRSVHASTAARFGALAMSVPWRQFADKSIA